MGEGQIYFTKAKPLRPRAPPGDPPPKGSPMRTRRLVQRTNKRSKSLGKRPKTKTNQPQDYGPRASRGRRAKLMAYVAHGGVARGLDRFFPGPVGVRMTRCGITEVKFASWAEGIQVDRAGGRYVSCRGSRQTRVPIGSAQSPVLGIVGGRGRSG